MPQKSFRVKFMFWIDAAKKEGDDLIEQIEGLKRERLFAKTLRDGIRLICDLRAGQTDVLFDLFPWIKDGLQISPTVPVEKGIQEQIARLEALLLAQGNMPIRSTGEQPIKGTSRQNSSPPIELSASKASAETIAANFINSMKGLASGFFD